MNYAPDDYREGVSDTAVSLPAVSFFFILGLVYWESDTLVSKYKVLLRIDGATITSASEPKL